MFNALPVLQPVKKLAAANQYSPAQVHRSTDLTDVKHSAGCLDEHTDLHVDGIYAPVRGPTLIISAIVSRLCAESTVYARCDQLNYVPYLDH